MRHRKKTTILGRKAAPRKALLRDLATSLVLHGRIQTTSAKGRALRPKIERLITVAKRGTLASRRQLLKTLRTETAVKKMMDSIAKQMKDRKGGYTRIQKIGARKGDGAEMVSIELVQNGKPDTNKN